MTIRRMRIACLIPKATNTHTVCVILIALPPQPWVHERASKLRHTCIASLVSDYRITTRSVASSVSRITLSFESNGIGEPLNGKW